MRYDTNKDGFVDRAEWKAGQEARFKQLDTNKDGKLTKDELFARTPAVGNSVLPPDRQVERQSSFFQPLDADKDGVVTLAEFMAQADRNFARCDLEQGRPHQHRRMPAGAAAPAGRTLTQAARLTPSYGGAPGGESTLRIMPADLKSRRFAAAFPSPAASPDAGTYDTSAALGGMMSPNSSQVSPLKRASWTAWIG